MLCQVRLTPSGSPSGALLYRYSGRRNIISCATVATSSPERLKIEPCASILPPCALGESSTYSSHSSARADEWLLYVLDSPSAQGGRMLAQGSIFNRSGELVATVAQEMMFRLPEYR